MWIKINLCYQNFDTFLINLLSKHVTNVFDVFGRDQSVVVLIVDFELLQVGVSFSFVIKFATEDVRHLLWFDLSISVLVTRCNENF